MTPSGGNPYTLHCKVNPHVSRRAGKTAPPINGRSPPDICAAREYRHACCHFTIGSPAKRVVAMCRCVISCPAVSRALGKYRCLLSSVPDRSYQRLIHETWAVPLVDRSSRRLEVQLVQDVFHANLRATYVEIEARHIHLLLWWHGPSAQRRGTGTLSHEAGGTLGSLTIRPTGVGLPSFAVMYSLRAEAAGRSPRPRVGVLILASRSWIRGA